MPPISSFGNWELKSKLGQGGFGEVHHWKNRATGIEIATKRLKDVSTLSADERHKLRERWNLEYKWTRELADASHIVLGLHLDIEENEFYQYLNSQHCCDLPVIVLEYCNGGDVRQQLQRSENANGLSELKVREILRALRFALDYLHRRCRVFHRDLKPDNIVIQRMPDGSKCYKLTDFGFARRSPEKTLKQSVVGTRHYFAPEVVDTATYNHKIDYWSLGVIAYELSCGVQPFIPHQTLINIIVNIRKKKRECIAITEDPERENQFVFHEELPAEQHLSNVWAKKLTQWLPSALDHDYKKRGEVNGLAMVTDEVQTPAIFSALDQLLDCKVLTVFAAYSYKRLAYEVTPSMSLRELGTRIGRDTGIDINCIYSVLPTGHPHKRITQQTSAMDLYVAEWQDTSEEAHNPPVMLYVFNAQYQCEYRIPQPSISKLMQNCMSSNASSLKPWLAERLVREMHFLLSEEQLILKMSLLSLKEYGMSLEDEMLNLGLTITDLKEQKLKAIGAMEHFQTLLKAGQEYVAQLQNNMPDWERNWRQLEKKYEDTKKSICGIVDHYESTLRNLREAIMSTVYDDIIKQDIYKVAQFRERYLRNGHVVNPAEFRDNIVVPFAEERNRFFNNVTIKHLREKINVSHHRFVKIKEISAVQQNLSVIRDGLLQLELQLLRNSISASKPSIIHQLNNSMQQLSVGATSMTELNCFDSLKTSNLISVAERTMELLDMEMDCNGE